MTHDEWVRWCDQMETSLTRATIYKKDDDLRLVLRLAWEICREQMKATEPKKGEKDGK